MLLKNYISSFSARMYVHRVPTNSRVRVSLSRFSMPESVAKSLSAIARIVHSFRPRTSVTDTRNLIFRGSR